MKILSSKKSMISKSVFQMRTVLFAFFLFFTSYSYGQTWKQLGPWGGAVQGMAGDTNLLLAGSGETNGGAFFGSRNGGNTWGLLPATLGLGNPIPFIKTFDGRIYFPYSPNFILNVSLDTGKTFQTITGGNFASPVCKTTSGKFFTTNPGWISLNGLQLINDPLIDGTKAIIGCVGNLLFAHNNTDSIFTSINDGHSWQFKSKLGITNASFGITSDGQFGKPWFYAVSPNILFIRNPDGSNTTGPLRKSIDGGTTWTTIQNGLPNSANPSSPYTFTLGGILFTANSSGVFRSTDLGETWEGVNTPVSGAQITCMYSWKNRIFIGTQFGGIYKSDNFGDDWSESLPGYQAATYTTFASSGSRINALNCANFRQMFSQDGGSNWIYQGAVSAEIICPNATQIKASVLFYFRDTLYANPPPGINNTKYSTDNGATFQVAARLNSSTANHWGIWAHNNILYKYEKTNNNEVNLFRTTNAGIRWDTVYKNPSEPGSFLFTGSKNSVYILNNFQSSTYKGLRSSNNGLNWVEFTLPVSFTGLQLDGLAAKGDSLFVITANAITPAFRSYNKGQTWTPLFQVGGASTFPLNRVIEKNGILYLSSSNGIYRSTNWGGTWQSMKGNYPFPEGTIMLDMQIKGDSLIVSVDNFGLWHTSLCQATASTITSSPCSGGSIQLLSSGGLNYSWSGPNNFTSTSSNPLLQNITTAATGTYTVTVNTPGGCSLQKSVTINVQPGAGILTITAPSVCAGGTLNLGVTGGNGTYQWSGPGGFIRNTQNPSRDTVTAADSGLYSVTVTAGNGCKSNKSIYVAVPYLPRANQIVPPNLSPCNRDTILLKAAFLLSGVTYQWFKNNVAIAGATNSTYPATTSGKYHFVYKKGTCQSEFADTIPVSFSGFRQPARPVLSINPPPTSCLQQFTINSTATGTYTRQWFRNGIAIAGATNATYSTNQLATYTLQVDSTGGCRSISAPFTVQLSGTQAFTSPQINTATVRLLPDNITMRCAVEWRRNDPVNANIQHVLILKQSDTQAGQYDSVGIATNADTAWIDPIADPVTKPYFYKIQARAICPSGGTYLTAPSSYHKTIHLQISKAPFGNVYNLLWTAYEGYTVSSYRIFRGPDINNTTLLASVAGNITSYSDAPPTTGDYFYKVEAETNDAYFPWGRINAIPRKSLSNIRNSALRTQDTSSIYNPVSVLEIGNGPSTVFRIYPNPHSGNFTISGGLEGRTYQAILRDVTGREIGNWDFSGGQLTEKEAKTPKGIYWLEIRGEGYRGGVRIVKE